MTVEITSCNTEFRDERACLPGYRLHACAWVGPHRRHKCARCNASSRPGESWALLDRLIDAKIAGTRTAEGYQFRTNENAAIVAADVVAQWLREKANELATRADSGLGNLSMVHMYGDQARAIEGLAASLTTPAEEAPDVA